MKVIIQIPCFNEEATLPATLADLPREIEGVDQVEWLVIDDGSTDRTVEAARANGVDHLVSMNGNQGLARAFMTGLVAAAELGADVIVNTDADNQYRAEDIPRLIAPILAGEADIVVGSRPIGTIRHFSTLKRLLQRLGSGVVRTVSGTRIRDAPSGFRAFTLDAALRLNVFSSYTYTLETVIQAGHSNLRLVDVPVRVNEPNRPSRLIRSIPAYLWRSTADILRTYLIYHPTRIFGALSLVFLAPSVFLAVRYLNFALMGAEEGKGHVQSVIASGVLALCAVFMLAIGVVAHLLGINRRLLEEIRYLEHARRLKGKAWKTPERRITDRPPDFVGGNVVDKYRTKNPVYRRLMTEFLGSCRELLADLGCQRVLEVGCGPGDLAQELAAGIPWLAEARYLGSDISLETVGAAPAGLLNAHFLTASVYRLPFPDAAFDCVIACEVFEHLEHPELALAEIERVAADYLLLSVPWEPVWRLLNVARGRYLKDLGNTPGHLQNFSRRAIRRLVASRFEIVAERRPLPWTVLLARRRKGDKVGGDSR